MHSILCRIRNQAVLCKARNTWIEQVDMLAEQAEIQSQDPSTGYYLDSLNRLEKKFQNFPELPASDVIVWGKLAKQFEIELNRKK